MGCTSETMSMYLTVLLCIIFEVFWLCCTDMDIILYILVYTCKPLLLYLLVDVLEKDTNVAAHVQCPQRKEKAISGDFLKASGCPEEGHKCCRPCAVSTKKMTRSWQ